MLLLVLFFVRFLFLLLVCYPESLALHFLPGHGPTLLVVDIEAS